MRHWVPLTAIGVFLQKHLLDGQSCTLLILPDSGPEAEA